VKIDLFGTTGSLSIEGDVLKMLAMKGQETLWDRAAAAHAISVAQGGTASVKDEAAHRHAAADPGAVWGDAHREQFKDFIRAIREDGQPLIDARAARKPVEIILAVYESARTGKTVTIPQASAT
jgi:UDP-N-acetyl-2-amino-2-deoxyglucuronate dehydrogenase